MHADYGVFRCRLKRLRIVLVLDQVRHVVGDMRAVSSPAPGDRPRLQAKEGFMQLGAIVRKIQRGLARRGKDGGTRRRFERGEMAVGSVTDTRQIPELQVNVVKKIGDVAVGMVSGAASPSGLGGALVSGLFSLLFSFPLAVPPAFSTENREITCTFPLS